MSEGKWVRVSENRWRYLTRREFLKATAAGAGLAAAGISSLASPTIIRAQPKTLRIMTWSHFVPAYDRWFDPFAAEWGKRKGITVTVDHISFADVTPRATAEVAAQSGHDLYFHLSPPSAFEPHAIDLTDIAKEAEKRYGPMHPLAVKSTYNARTKKYYAFSDNWVPDPGDYLKSVWTNVGFPNGPRTWDDLLAAGREIRKKHPEIQIPIGVGFSQDIDSNMASRAIWWANGASIQDKDENVVLRSEQTIRSVEYGVRLFREAMNPAVLSWNAASNNQALNARQTAYILNSISAYRTAQDNKLPVADDIFFVPALRGSAAAWASEHVMGCWVVWKFARSPDNAKAFLLDLVDNYREAVMASKLYNFPSFMGSVADKSVPVARKPEEGRRWLRGVVSTDPFGSKPADKLVVIANAVPRKFARSSTGKSARRSAPAAGRNTTAVRSSACPS
ncbi:MAG: extracellular solute-binding protein, partial [Armatimonadetes bacterium]|nr:extracellular solute-binding protein [Armatimonadota bacterium]